MKQVQVLVNKPGQVLLTPHEYIIQKYMDKFFNKRSPIMPSLEQK
jgi:hypothetical protein